MASASSVPELPSNASCSPLGGKGNLKNCYKEKGKYLSFGQSPAERAALDVLQVIYLLISLSLILFSVLSVTCSFELSSVGITARLCTLESLHSGLPSSWEG